MKKRGRRRAKKPPFLPLMLAELSVASWETIARRSLIMATGACTPAEYRRMVEEKMRAARQSAAAGTSPVALLAPWHRRATANARRLRRR